METKKQTEPKKTEKCYKDKEPYCKAVLPVKHRCSNGLISSSMGKYRPANSPCMDSQSYQNLIE